MNKQMIVDELVFDVRESSRRKTLEIIVDRDGSLVLATPSGISDDKRRTFIEGKLIWVHTKLVEKNNLIQPRVNKEYVQGEGFYYLGRHHRLRLVDQQEVPLRLYRGRFTLLKSEAEQGKKHFMDWYSEHLGLVLSRHLETLLKRLDQKPKQIHIQDLGYKWGSTDRRNHLYFHWRVAMLPHRMIEYIVAHELTHLSERSHSDIFWQQLERLVPDYLNMKKWLAEEGGLFDL
jgi:predicted metal-dependent hydrolase